MDNNPDKITEEIPSSDFNTWLKQVEKQLAGYPDNLQVQGATHIYEGVYERMSGKVSEVRSTLTMAEKVLDTLPFKINK